MGPPGRVGFFPRNVPPPVVGAVGCGAGCVVTVVVGGARIAACGSFSVACILGSGVLLPRLLLVKLPPAYAVFHVGTPDVVVVAGADELVDCPLPPVTLLFTTVWIGAPLVAAMTLSMSPSTRASPGRDFPWGQGPSSPEVRSFWRTAGSGTRTVWPTSGRRSPSRSDPLSGGTSATPRTRP